MARVESGEAPGGEAANPKLLAALPALDAREASSALIEGYALLPDGTHARIKEIYAWGVRLVAPRVPTASLCEEIRFRLYSDTHRVLVQCTARVVGIAQFDLGCEIMLWVVGDKARFRRLVARAQPPSHEAPRPRFAVSSSRLPADRAAPRLRSLASERARVLVRSIARPDAPVIPARLDPERGLLMEWHPGWAMLEAPFEIQVEGPFSTVQFIESSLCWDGLPRPSEATVVHRRQLRRVAVPSGARVLLRGSVDGEPVSLDLPMHDVSFGGVAAVIDCDAMRQLQAGAEISDVIVTWRGGPGLRFAGEVRHRSPHPNRNSEILGLRLHGASDDQQERWAREVETLLYPLTRSYGHDYESIWSLYEESGYFDISACARRDSQFQLLRNAFEAAYKKIEAAPHLGCLATYESPTRVEASICGLRAWSHSWFGTQLARNPVRPHIANSDSGPLKEIIFHVYERAGANPDLDWIVHYVRDDAPSFSQVLFRDLVLSVPGACGVPFEVWQLDVTMLGESSTPNVRTATHRQVGQVLRRLGSLRPMQYLEALDLTPASVSQEGLRHEWAIHGLERERELLVAWQDGEIVAAALLEIMEEGLHVYGLLDGVRIFELEPGGRDHFAALLSAANEWFFSRGKSRFVCYEEDGLRETMLSAGARSMGTAVTTILPRHATPELLERVAELTVPKLGL